MDLSLATNATTLDSIFGSLADPTRRDILRRVATTEMSVSDIAKPYDLTLAAISKHLGVLERARLIVKRRQGKEQIVALSPTAFADANEYLQWYQQFMQVRLDSLDNYLNNPSANLG
jgi:DNA-binding transcriptional ArsR family regulator